jgi:hypothetical protein
MMMRKKSLVAMVFFCVFGLLAFLCWQGPEAVAQEEQHRVYLPLVARDSSWRGGLMAYDDMHCEDITKANAEWWANWGIENRCPGVDVEFVPQVWGRIWEVPELDDGGEWLMGFNETNYAGQAVMTPYEAAGMWHLLEATGRKLVSPSVAACEPGADPRCLYSPYQWMDEFFAACDGCRIDVIAVHWYGSRISDLMRHLDKMSEYGRPLWLTEWGCVNNSLECMQQALPIVQQKAERHAWFALRLDPARMPPVDRPVAVLTLIDPWTGKSTPLGEWYRVY